MHCGSTSHPLSDAFQSPHGEKFGANVAHEELMHAVLRNDDAIHWDIWDSAIESSVTNKRSRRMDATPWQMRYGTRVLVKSIQEAHILVDETNYLFVGSVHQTPTFAHLRRQIGCTKIPFCGLLHAVIDRDMLSTYASIGFNMGPSDILVATSAAGKKALQTALERGIASVNEVSNGKGIDRSSQIVQIPLGVNVPDPDQLDQASARRLLNISTGAFVVLYVGRFSEQYKADLDGLLEAIKNISRSVGEVRLILAGQSQDNYYVKQLRSRIALLGLSSVVSIFESFPEVLKTPLFAASDVFVSPVDSVQETFGIAILEAMAHGKPVVAPDWSGYRDLVVNGKTGFLLPTYWSAEAAQDMSRVAPLLDAYDVSHYLAQRTLTDVGSLCECLEVLQRDREKAVSLGLAGRQRVLDHFVWHKIARRFINLWSEQINKAHSPAKDEALLASIDYDAIFSHYASRSLNGSDRVISCDDVQHRIDTLADQFGFSDENDFDQICRILEICKDKGLTVEALKEQCYSQRVISWVVKKGLCRLVPKTKSTSEQ